MRTRAVLPVVALAGLFLSKVSYFKKFVALLSNKNHLSKN